ncbi:MAG: GntR family transcriptional regulator [Rhodoglobus sp.]
MDNDRPIFAQVAENIENDVISGALPEEGQVPSTNEIAAFYRINPATALKGVTMLVDEGILYKKRGIGMFVATGAQNQLIGARREKFSSEYVRPLLAEANKIGIDSTQLTQMIAKEAKNS